jgi:hypothetical protein
LACPFFIPTHRADDLALPHPARLPLGAAWRGSCAAPGHEQATPSDRQLESCNLGYAETCPRLPKDRTCDAVRFAVAGDSGGKISVRFVFEWQHLPAGHGFVEYDRLSNAWTSTHREPRIQRLAECFMQSYLDKKTEPTI